MEPPQKNQMSTTVPTPSTVGSGCFTCRECGKEWHFDFFGHKPPFAPLLVFLEEAYVMRDPFPNPKQHSKQQAALFLGSKCSVCKEDVCQGKQCSLFYAKRFCMTCAASNKQHFPTEILKMLE